MQLVSVYITSVCDIQTSFTHLEVVYAFSLSFKAEEITECPDIVTAICEAVGDYNGCTVIAARSLNAQLGYQWRLVSNFGYIKSRKYDIVTTRTLIDDLHLPDRLISFCGDDQNSRQERKENSMHVSGFEIWATIWECTTANGNFLLQSLLISGARRCSRSKATPVARHLWPAMASRSRRRQYPAWYLSPVATCFGYVNIVFCFQWRQFILVYGAAMITGSSSGRRNVSWRWRYSCSSLSRS